MSDQQIGRVTFGPPLSDGERAELMRRVRISGSMSVHAGERINAEVSRLHARVERLEALLREARDDLPTIEEHEVDDCGEPRTYVYCSACGGQDAHSLGCWAEQMRDRIDEELGRG